MIPGSINFWDLVEFIYYLDRLNWEGWIAYDVVTRNGDLVESMGASIDVVEVVIKLLDKFGRDRLQGLINDGIPACTFQQLVRSLL